MVSVVDGESDGGVGDGEGSDGGLARVSEVGWGRTKKLICNERVKPIVRSHIPGV